MDNVIPVKRFETLLLPCGEKLPVGEWVVKCQIKNRARTFSIDAIVEPSATVVSTNEDDYSLFQLRIDSAATGTFPLSGSHKMMLEMDVFFVQGGG